MSDPIPMKHGDAERLYDFMVTSGANPEPWQYELLRRLEDASMNYRFTKIVTDWKADHE